MSNLGTSSGSVAIGSVGANLSSLNLTGKGWVGAQTSAITSSTATDYGQTFTVPASQTISLKVGGSHLYCYISNCRRLY